jgi:hypothetical protein
MHRYRADVDYYPRLFSMILDQLEYIAANGDGDKEMFHVEFGNMHEVANLARTKQHVVEHWAKFAEDGRDHRLKVVPMRF